MNNTLSTADNLNVIYEDNHIIVINKRSGDIVQGDKTGDAPLSEVVKKYIAIKYGKPGAVYLGVVHRLDRPTSGIVVFARTSKALPRLNKAFAERETRKTYWALVKNPPPTESGTLIHYLKRNPKQNKSYAHKHEVPDSKKAILDYRVIKKLKTFYLLEIDLHTGRHHQIRAQLTAMGSPIKGDLKYGFDRSNPDGSISLLSRKLTLTHPVKKEEMTFTAEVPEGDAVWKACN
ncbi:RluA family pseudouridine synthase [uncultured Dokdonia sp.]|uniref:RluA family pseudouridine synthase n=1 Tax=uncultured Dokdonia sp. TaxID=575653 RepID=UPI0030EE2AFE|tara:strand:+ start:63926 stop:64624 length:699 start_codon:yes stop_codon:yes gene_type:complete